MDDLELLIIPSAKITDMYHHTQWPYQMLSVHVLLLQEFSTLSYGMGTPFFFLFHK